MFYLNAYLTTPLRTLRSTPWLGAALQSCVCLR
jgi:hypothetical protein